jgi:hypothetical protein
MSVEPLTSGTPVRSPRAPHAPRPVRTTHPRPRRTTRPGAAPARARLTPLPAARAAAPRAPFVLLIVALLGLGLLALLFLNTASAQDAFRLSDLQRQSKALADQEQTLSRQAADLSDPANVAAAADRLGMVPGAVPIFLKPGQKVPAGQQIDGMIVVPAPRQTKSTQPAQPPQPTAGTAPTKKAVTPPVKKPASKTTGATAGSVSPDVVKALKNFQQFQRFAEYIKNHPELAKRTTTSGANP